MLDPTNIFSKFPRIVYSVQHMSVFYVYKWLEIASTYLLSRKVFIGIPSSSLTFFNIGIIDFYPAKYTYNMHFPVGIESVYVQHKKLLVLSYNVQYTVDEEYLIFAHEIK
jgi:hypothetical protein